MTIGEKILNLRKARGWSQEELAERVGVTRQAVSRWESGAAKPDTDKVIALCDLFGVSADYLIRDGYSGEAVQAERKPFLLWEAIKAVELPQWGAFFAVLGGGVTMLVLYILSRVYPEYAYSSWFDTEAFEWQWESHSGLLVYIGNNRLWWLAAPALAGIGYGCWRLFLKKLVLRWWSSDEAADLRTLFSKGERP